LIGPKSVARQGQEGFVGDHCLEISAEPQPSGQPSNVSGRQLRYEQAMELRPLLEQLQASLINTNHSPGTTCRTPCAKQGAASAK